MKINPKFLYNKEGEKEQVLLSYKDFMKLIEKIEDLEDLISLREAREENKGQPLYSIEDIMEKYNVTPEDEEETHSKKKAQ